ncbi:ABC transporter ATP-binding protein [Cronobacter dublinensis]|uniref:ABC transporter ATP-binding protein n=1 Tax=Cronobacter dublinensis TaxID=413497 RepID=UPI00029C7B17|nr:ABC transporter ATP-binding protein [Cronobacter dublinensis]MDI6439542.1 ABC transporter ATP-binding protein [Cronobacter dublinensis]NCH96548.1 ABC transporter ATP-binding protein [Cronobacter dublinensis]CCJ84654.1 Lipid A export ATP-binding/permease protein MsbA [Cronobacter dublinensis 582]
MPESLFRFFENLINPFQEKDAAFCQNRKDLWYFIKKIRVIVLMIALIGLLKAAVDVGIIYSVGLVIDSLNGTLSPSVSKLLTQNQLLILAACLFVFIRPLTSLFLGLLCDQCIRARFSPMVRWMFYNKVINNDVAFFNRNHAGKIASAVWQAGQAVTEFLLSALQMIWSNVAYVILALSFMSALNFSFTVVIVLWLAVYLYLSTKYAPEIKRRSRKSADASNTINGHLVDIFSNVLNVKSLSPAGDDSAFVKDKLNDFIEKNTHFLRAITCAETLLMVTSSVALMITGYICVSSWRAGLLSVGEISAVFGLVFRLEGQLATLMDQLTSAMRTLGLFNASIDTIHHQNHVTDGDAKIAGKRMSGDITLCNVHFRYEADKPVLEGVNIHIRSGEKVAIVGESGSGKSTLINLLLRFYDPAEGTVVLDGRDIREYPLNMLRQQFSLVTQENMLFNRTIYENITFGCSDFTEEDVWEAARKAKALDFILQATDGTHSGFETMTGDRGIRLSGGQRQRLSICRAILRNSPVLILDEATSALDSLTEAEVRDAMNEAMEGKTVIAIAHRLSSVTGMDRIIVLQKGGVREEGAHDELVKLQGSYYALWKQQAHI